jgi:hypothetical protein
MEPVNRVREIGIDSLSRPAVGGWLLVLCLLLVIWQPISTGLVASSVLDSLTFRGIPLALILAVRVLVTGFGVGAGLALLGRRPGAVALAKVSLIAAAATDLFVYLTPYFPSNRAPGETPIVVIASMTYYVAWLAYLGRSRRVRAIFAASAPT